MLKLMSLSSVAFVSACLSAFCAFGENDKNSDSSRVNVKETFINTKDDLNISIKYYIPESREKLPAVILLHMLGKDKSSWDRFIPLLVKAGYAVFNVDLRGHGRSVKMQTGKEIFFMNMNETDWKKLPDDVIDVVNFVRQSKYVISSQIGIVGASIGANAGIIDGSEYPDKIKTVVALSPGMDYHGLQIFKPAQNIKIPVLIAVSEEDVYSYESANQLNTVVNSEHNLLIYNGNQHGTNLLNQSEKLENEAVNWLNEHLKR